MARLGDWGLLEGGGGGWLKNGIYQNAYFVL